MREHVKPMKEFVKTDFPPKGNSWRHVEPQVYINGKHFRETLRKPLPIVKQVPVRVVPAFSLESLQKNTVVQKLPRSRPRPKPQNKPSLFQIFYKRGDIPISLNFSNYGMKLLWRVEVDKLDFQYYLPLFFEGLKDTQRPFSFLAFNAIHDLLRLGGDKILPCIPQIILPLKGALDTRNKKVVTKALKALQMLVESSVDIGQALVPYYRQLLPSCNLFIHDRSRRKIDLTCTGDSEVSLGKLVEDTLHLLEITGGNDAYINIKYMVPHYQSCILK